jgi:hypothetical protein
MEMNEIQEIIYQNRLKQENNSEVKYHIYKVFTSKHRIYVASFGTRNEAERCKESIDKSETRQWTTEIITEII